MLTGSQGRSKRKLCRRIVRPTHLAATVQDAAPPPTLTGAPTPRTNLDPVPARPSRERPTPPVSGLLPAADRAAAAAGGHRAHQDQAVRSGIDGFSGEIADTADDLIGRTLTAGESRRDSPMPRAVPGRTHAIVGIARPGHHPRHRHRNNHPASSACYAAPSVPPATTSPPSPGSPR